MDFPFPKINFDDINKFEASWGVFLLIASVASFVFKEESKTIPLWVKIIVLTIALVAIVRGLYKWRKRQNKLDEKLNLEIVSIQTGLKNATDEQVKEKAKQKAAIFSEIQKDKTEECPNKGKNGNNDIENKKQSIEKYFSVTRKMFQKLSKINNQHYIIQTQKTIGNYFLYDLIYKSLHANLNDKIVEIKYVRELREDNCFINKLLDGLEILISVYRRNIRKQADLVLVVVYDNSTVDTEQIRNKIRLYTFDNTALHGMQIQFIKEQKINEFNANYIL